jgi:hypothetical protein
LLIENGRLTQTILISADKHEVCGYLEIPNPRH